MVRNSRVGQTTVDSTGGRVHFEGAELVAPPAESITLNRLYFL
jgi:hypothetical protein